MLKFFSTIFDENAKRIKQYERTVEEINAWEPRIQKLTDRQLAQKTQDFRQHIVKERAKGREEQAILNELLPEAFAVVREASRRVIGLRHFDVQLIAGIALHHGMVTEQKTGEGKTLTVTAPLYLNALLGKGAHLVTVNDYLAEIGVGWMGPIYHFLGLTSAVIVHDHAKLYNPDIDSEERGDERLEHFEEITRQAAYAADVTYGTNNEFGFDYLRDNMVGQVAQMVQRPVNAHQFAIVDEADSILIDEARTPLIISAPDTEPTKKYYDFAKMVEVLGRDVDYKLDEKMKTVTLTDLGVKRIEQKLGINNLYEESFDVIHHVEAALKAKTLYHRDKEYIVREDQVIIVDEHTGRLMFGRRYSDGLHQAIEAKEGVSIQQESRTLATISLQNYFRMYVKLSGMSGTVVTEAEEFRKIYEMDTLVVPTHQPVVRVDMADVVYKTTAAKYSAIVREVEKFASTGQPVLLGTRSIEHNQIIADFLSRKHIAHQVLNAKNHEKEAFIIADAGKKGAITVATNIAGRGVDIVLGGAKPELKDFRKKNISKNDHSKPTAEQKKLITELRLPPSINPNHYKLTDYARAVERWQADHDEVVALGGLHIIGSERHESRRIDNQLRGRSGRQGDPGSTQFFLSLEDEIMRLFGGAQIAKLMDFLKIEEDQPIEHGMVGNAIQSAQVKVEGFFFDQRKRLVEFDDVMNKQREIIYKRRRRILEAATPEESGKTKSAETENTKLRDEVLDGVHHEISSMVMLRAPQHFTSEEFDAIVKEFTKIIPFDDNSQQELRRTISDAASAEEIIARLNDIATKTYQTREDIFGSKTMRDIERYVVLSTIDEKWMDHLDAMDNLRDGIWMRGDKTTVLSEYKKEGFQMFESLVQNIEETISSRIFRVQPQDKKEPVVIDTSKIIEQKADIHQSLAAEVSHAEEVAAPKKAARTQKGSASDFAAVMGGAKAGVKAKPGVAQVKIGRNDPCPCGSGLKWKKCGMIGASQHRS